ncbi:hypothetical protein CRV24_008593 [Beauveria bassiana]|nr:hypothetical protein CRV24_008593 [Beauveria bassiana]KAH8716677.1 hypothetical protein HC256_005436 [Beauveria bassiana]
MSGSSLGRTDDFQWVKDPVDVRPTGSADAMTFANCLPRFFETLPNGEADGEHDDDEYLKENHQVDCGLHGGLLGAHVFVSVHTDLAFFARVDNEADCFGRVAQGRAAIDNIVEGQRQHLSVDHDSSIVAIKVNVGVLGHDGRLCLAQAVNRVAAVGKWRAGLLGLEIGLTIQSHGLDVGNTVGTRGVQQHHISGYILVTLQTDDIADANLLPVKLNPIRAWASLLEVAESRLLHSDVGFFVAILDARQCSLGMCCLPFSAVVTG